MRSRNLIVVFFILVSSCKFGSTESQITSTGNRPGLAVQAFINRPAGSLLRSCCLCLTDGAFPANDVYCQTEFNRKYMDRCDATIIGPRLSFSQTYYEQLNQMPVGGEAGGNYYDEDDRYRDYLIEEKNAQARVDFEQNYLGALLAKAGSDYPRDQMCKAHLYVQVNGHSGGNTYESEVSPIARICVANKLIPFKISGDVTGCQGNAYPDDIERVIRELQSATGADFVSAGGNQCFDPGVAGKDWTYCRVTITKKTGLETAQVETRFHSCHAAGKDCTFVPHMGMHIEHGMGARCFHGKELVAQFCCPMSAAKDKFSWTQPYSLQNGEIPASPCGRPQKFEENIISEDGVDKKEDDEEVKADTSDSVPGDLP